MRDYISNLLFQIKLDDYKDVFLDAYDKIVASKKANAILISYVEKYKNSKHIEYETMQEDLTAISNDICLPYQTICSVYVFCLSKYLEEVYKSKNIDSKFLHDALMDFNWKNKECFDAKGVYGTNTLLWHVKILNGDVIAIGRLQYELITAENNYVTKSYSVIKGQPLVSVHIPSSGKLDYEAVKISYVNANKFFKKRIENVIFYCSSWLLWEKHKEILSENSNIVKFSSDYELFEHGIYENDQGLKRVFPKDFLKPYIELPENNTLQKAYKKLLLEGKKAGFGSGLMKQ